MEGRRPMERSGRKLPHVRAREFTATGAVGEAKNLAALALADVLAWLSEHPDVFPLSVTFDQREEPTQDVYEPDPAKRLLDAIFHTEFTVIVTVFYEDDE